MRNIRRNRILSLLSFLMGIALLFLITGKKVEAAVTETCGDSAVWTYDEDEKVLTITGSGKVVQTDDWYELEIKKIVIGEGITEIGDSAFMSLKEVTEVKLPSSLESIGFEAFYYCKKLTKITLPNSLKQINDLAFGSCSKLKSIKIPDSVTYLGNGLFESCKSLSKVTLPASMNRIPDRFFSGCKKLTSFEFTDNIVEVGYYAFYRTGLKSITIPKTVQVYDGAFGRCESLESVEWKTDTIPYRAFDGCKNLVDIKLSSNVRTIGESAFSRTGITEYVIPESITFLGNSAFAYCEGLKKLTISKNIKEVPARIVSGCPSIEKVVLEDGIKTIASRAFSGSDIKSIKLPSTIKKIGDHAFSNCKYLTSITLPDHVKKIEDYTFSKCVELKKVKFGSGVKEIGEYAFYGCTGLDKITIPGQVKQIKYKAFKNAGISTLVISDGVEEIDYWAFAGCPNLTKVNIGKDVSKLQYSAFLQCEKLTSINVDKNNKKYTSNDGALYSKDMKKMIACPAGKSGVFTVPSSVEKIYGSAFSRCYNITGFKINSDNRNFSVQDGILYNKNKTVLVACAPGMKGTIRIPSTVTDIADYAFHYSQAKEIILPSKLKTIGYCSFEYCDNLERITIPGSVKSIERAAFYGCNALTEVEIGKGLTKILDDTFYGCNNLEKIKVPVSVTSISSTAFNGCSYRLTFYVKKSSYAAKFASKNYYKIKKI